MAYDDEIEDEYGDESDYEDHDLQTGEPDVEEMIQRAERGLDPLDFSDPESTYLFLSDDAQDEIEGTGSRRMKCCSCGHIFRGEPYDCCPECLNPDTKEK